MRGVRIGFYMRLIRDGVLFCSSEAIKRGMIGGTISLFPSLIGSMMNTWSFFERKVSCNGKVIQKSCQEDVT